MCQTESSFHECKHDSVQPNFCSPSLLWSRRRDHVLNFELPSFLSCFQFLSDEASMRMASYKRLNPEDVLLSCPALAKEPSALQKEFSVSLDANLLAAKLECRPNCVNVYTLE